jgi:hypothetical protein
MDFITANQCVVLISASMQRAVCPSWCLEPASNTQACAIVTLSLHPLQHANDSETGRGSRLQCGVMSPVTNFSNRVLPSMPPVEFEALRPHLEIVELVRVSALVDGGISLTDAIVRLEGKSPQRHTASIIVLVLRSTVCGCRARHRDVVTMTGSRPTPASAR